jgi:hypothetical protein
LEVTPRCWNKVDVSDVDWAGLLVDLESINLLKQSLLVLFRLDSIVRLNLLNLWYVVSIFA